jgi:hypothetical protein
MEHLEGISNVEAENIVKHWIESDNIDGRVYSKLDKQKLLRNIYEINPNNTKESKLKKLSDNINSIFNKDEIIDLSKEIIRINYKPGVVLYHIRAYNDGVIDFISSFNCIEMYKGIIINKTFIGDMLKVFPDVLFNKDSGAITDPDIDQKLSIFLDYIRQEFIDIKICIKNDVYVIATDNKDTIEKLKTHFEKLKIESIPFYYFNWI